ncbi:MAG: ion transporter [Limnohabitans sp.]|nr:ion transporter [Limnohabitans sp.]
MTALTVRNANESAYPKAKQRKTITATEPCKKFEPNVSLHEGALHLERPNHNRSGPVRAQEIDECQFRVGIPLDNASVLFNREWCCMRLPEDGQMLEVTPKGRLAWLHRWFFDTGFQEGHARLVENGVAWLIIFSVMAIAAEHVEPLHARYAVWFHVLDVMTVGVFTVEYLLRVLIAPLEPEFAGRRFARVRYIFSFYALVDLMAIAPFYLASLGAMDVEMLRALRLLRLLRVFKLSRYMIPAWKEFHAMNHGRSFRGKLYALLEPTGHSGQLHVYFDNFIMFWVLLSIVSVVLETVASIHDVLAFEFKVIDAVAFSIFTLEYLARLYAAPENPAYKRRWLPRWAHMRSGHAIIDLLAILPFLLEHFLPFALDLRFLRVFRLMRLLKLTRYTSATVTLYKVVKREWQVIFASVFVMLLLVVLTASMGYLFEHEAQPDKFENIPQSIYWAVVTLASVGYGDISPITPMGRALTVVLALLGIGIFAIPAGLLASAFTDQLRIDRETFKQKLLHAYESGELNPRARAMIAEETERLHLSAEDIQRLTQEAREAFHAKQREEKHHTAAVVLDPRQHPDLAARQFQVLIAQLQLLHQAAGEENLRQQLLPLGTGGAVAVRVLDALSH